MQWKYYRLMYKNGKMTHVETILGLGEREKKEGLKTGAKY
jgi:hypothetical protein